MVVKQYKNSDFHSIFHNATATVNLFCTTFRNTSRNVFDMCNKVFSLSFGMGNPNSSTFLGNVQWKLVKHYKNSDFHSIFHNATVTVNLFEILQ